MFEEICLTCSKRLPDDGRAYCSDKCEALDASNSPSVSTASSALSSPYLDYAIGEDVPPLVPSALGSALSSLGKRDRYSTSSSSTSSASWSLFTDLDEDDAPVSIGDSFTCDGERPDAPLEASSRFFAVPLPSKSSLNYARRPSTTNHRSLIPLLHSRNPSNSSVASIQNSSSVENDVVDYAHHAIWSDNEKTTLEHDHEADKSTIGSKSTKSRNRASLPAYFSLLKINTPRHSPPLSSSSGNTINIHQQPSPPTPKLASLLAVSGLRSPVEATPRGRRREPSLSRSRRRSQSRSRSRSQAFQASVSSRRGRQDSRSTLAPVLDWTCAPISRGRTMRRNSSPLPKMMLSIQEFEDPALIAGPNSYLDKKRGRYRMHELDSTSECEGPARYDPRERGRAIAAKW
ncbi:hypothetical protein EDC04DRAFT_2935491 [Pisolithus marmoratus]|nr:hypothetical protein EDC04DRAFT_2935491 [Pisolithus marmoratus]